MSETILVVDDDPSNLRLVAHFLDLAGYSVLKAASGEEALELVREPTIDLVITDLQMPGINGLELAERLIDEDPDRPVIMMTGYADLESARRAVRLGLYDYYAKPLTLKDFGVGVRRGLDWRRMRREIKAYQNNLESMVAERTKELNRKVQELQARDALLRELLSMHGTDELLDLALRLTMDLCRCQAGVLYTLESDRRPIPRAVSAGYEVLQSQAAVREVEGLLGQAAKKRRPVLDHNVETLRSRVGIPSLGILPVLRGETVTALLEVGRRTDSGALQYAVLEEGAKFMPYVAMAVAECRLQERLPDWEEDVDLILSEVDGLTLPE